MSKGEGMEHFHSARPPLAPRSTTSCAFKCDCSACPRHCGEQHDAALVIWIAILTGVAAAFASPYSYAIGLYRVTDIGDLFGSNSATYAYDINESGQIVGQTQTPQGDHAFLYSNGSMQDLGTLGGDFSIANAINDSGQIVGYSHLSSNPSQDGYHAFLHNGVDMLDLGTLGGKFSIAHDINNSGVVVGYAERAGTSDISRGFVYDGVSMQDAGGLTGTGSVIAVGVNGSGQIAMNIAQATTQFQERAYLKTNTNYQDLGTLSGDQAIVQTVATAINDSAHVVGWSVTPDSGGGLRAFIHRGDSMVDLGTIGSPDVWSQALDVSDSGVVVGRTSIGPGDNGRAFVWDANEGMINLNDRIAPDDPLKGQVLFQSANAINEKGEIVGSGVTPRTIAASGLLFTPITQNLPGALGTKPNGGSLYIVGGQFDPQKSTIVLTHGWQPGEVYTPNDMTDFPLLGVRDAVVSRLTATNLINDVNVVSFEWQDAYTEQSLGGLGVDALMALLLNPNVLSSSYNVVSDYLDALGQTQSAGHVLAESLLQLGISDSERLQFVGHSLGAMVSTYAIQELARTGITSDQLTILDAPNRFGAASEFFYEHLPFGDVDYVDNFYAVTGGDILGAAPAAELGEGGYSVPFAGHTSIHQAFYSDRVGTAEWTSAVLDTEFSSRPSPPTWDPRPYDGVGTTVSMVSNDIIETEDSDILGVAELDTSRPGWRAVVNDATATKQFSLNVLGEAAEAYVDQAGRIIYYFGPDGTTITQASVSFATNTATFAIESSGGPSLVDGTYINDWIGLEESSPVVIRRDIEIPENARLLEFDYLILGAGDGDWLTLHFNDLLLFSIIGEDFVGTPGVGTVPISLFAGEIGSLYFTLNSVGDRNAQFLLKDIRLLSASPVPLPKGLWLLMCGATLLLCLTRCSRVGRQFRVTT